MKRFDFRLKSVLVLRQRLLNEAESQYSRAIQARRGVEAQIQQAETALDSMNEMVMSVRGERFSGTQQQSYFEAMHQHRSGIKSLKEQLDKALQMEHFKRRKYIEANRDYELLEKLREKQKQKHFHEELLKEQLLQDDLFNARRAVMNAARSS